MHNGTTVRFSSHNSEDYNGRKEYLVFHHGKDFHETIGVTYYANGFWHMGKYQFKMFNELKAAIRHKYTGSPLD